MIRQKYDPLNLFPFNISSGVSFGLKSLIFLKRDIKTGKNKKWKARLNINSSRIQKGIHYDQTYAPVASWKPIRLLLIMVAKK
jgi:hypothetical protein